MKETGKDPAVFFLDDYLFDFFNKTILRKESKNRWFRVFRKRPRMAGCLMKEPAVF